jgi:hypothetical protein
VGSVDVGREIFRGDASLSFDEIRGTIASEWRRCTHFLLTIWFIRFYLYVVGKIYSVCLCVHPINDFSFGFYFNIKKMHIQNDIATMSGRLKK